MVDFSKRLGKKTVEKPIDPHAIYERLDRASDKGALRDPQRFILKAWHEQRRDKKDVILKLHTGQGKTLIGLLILQSKIHEGAGPALYLCPDRHLVDQTCEQARQFGITVCRADEEVPPDYFDSKAILVTTVHKLFNGLTKFGLGLRSIKAGSVLMDDCHACVDAIREAVSIRAQNNSEIYNDLLGIFSEDLKQQGAGTFEDLKAGKHDALLPVPYWAWESREEEVVKQLARHSTSAELRFVWPLLKDRLDGCMCFFSGSAVEIVPYMPPLDLFGTYWNAQHRVFMSATVTDDSFLVKGMCLSKEAILNPLIYPDEKWSGEKMILIPSLIDDGLDRSEIVNIFGRPQGRPYGVIAIAPSFARTRDWEKLGAEVADKGTIELILKKLRTGSRNITIVLVNRYDGIDLPDDQCRVLILDSLPHSDSLHDRYLEQCRSGSDIVNVRVARSIEQGLGRSVRGEKDFSVIIIIGPELVKFLRQPHTREFLSEQTRRQVEIGLEIAEMANDEGRQDEDPVSTLVKLITQCIRRDEAWKEFYIQEMDTLCSGAASPKGLELFEAERASEMAFRNLDYNGAVSIIQTLLDSVAMNEMDRGYYLQEMARFCYKNERVRSMQLQLTAHQKNHFLLRPIEGFSITKLVPRPGLRIANIIEWVQKYESGENLIVAIDDICNKLNFGANSDDFEGALHDLGRSLGFSSERPCKEWKEGPDNLWCLQEGDYLLIEAKNEVKEDRVEINRKETGQFNNSCAWFRKNYKGASLTARMIMPTENLAKGAAFNEDVGIIRKKDLTALKRNVRKFFGEFKVLDFKSLDEAAVGRWLSEYELSVGDIKTKYCKPSYSGLMRGR